MSELERVREEIAGEDGPENLYTEEMVDRLLFAADKDFAVLKAQIKWLERNSVLKNPAQVSIFDRAEKAEAVLSAAEQRAVEAERRAETSERLRQQALDANAGIRKERNAAEADRDRLRMALQGWATVYEWLYDLAEIQTCSDVCDKTWEQQGCPSGTCAREDGLSRLRNLWREADQALSASPAPSAAAVVRDGYILVPVEPTVEMLRAGVVADSDGMFDGILRRIYKAMLAAYTADPCSALPAGRE